MSTTKCRNLWSNLVETYGRKPYLESDGRISKFGRFMAIESSKEQSTLGSYKNVEFATLTQIKNESVLNYDNESLGWHWWADGLLAPFAKAGGVMGCGVV